MLTQVIANSLVVGASYALFAISFGIVYRVAGFLHIAHGAIYTAAAYGLFTAEISLGLPPIASSAFAIACAVALGVIVEMCIYCPLQRRRAGVNVLLLASLGVMIVIQNVISAIFGDGTQTVNNGAANESLVILNARLTPVQCVSLVTAALVAILVSMLLQRTKWGTSVRAVASDADLTLIIGIRMHRVRLMVYALASACVAVAAILDAHITDVTPGMGFHLMLMGMTACVVGGIGSIWGALLGSFVIALLQQATAWNLSAQWQEVGVFLVLILMLLIRPQGFFGRPLRRANV